MHATDTALRSIDSGIQRLILLLDDDPSLLSPTVLNRLWRLRADLDTLVEQAERSPGAMAGTGGPPRLPR